MPLKILLTADVHLGLKFAGFPVVQFQLSEARYLTLQKLVDLANQRSCDLLVVAGDLFDLPRLPERDVVRAAQILSGFGGGLVAVLPGNHDFFSPQEPKPWTRFKASAGDRVLLLEEKRPYALGHYGLDVAIYPGPCQAHRSAINAVGWIRDAVKDSTIQFHIGIAHGSLRGVSPDEEGHYFPMTKEELASYGLDLWLLGHTDRLQYPQTPGPFDRIYYPGTPEPNAFNCKHPGKCWVLTLDDEKVIHADSVETGQYRFLHEERVLSSEADLLRLQEWFDRPEISTSLVKLALSGRIDAGLFEGLPRVLETARERAFHLETHKVDLKTLITPAMISREFSSDSFPYRLLTSLSAREADQEALQVAYDLVKELRR
jgi:exonuclease SbcD